MGEEGHDTLPVNGHHDHKHWINLEGVPAAETAWSQFITTRRVFEKGVVNIRPRDFKHVVLSVGKRVGYACVPQLVRTYYFDDPVPVTKLNSTSWMNGLRGIASLVVFNEHYVYNFTRTLLRGIGTHEGDVWIHQLPVFELFNDGVCGVVIFFTVAGYVCSFNSLRAMTAGDAQSLFKSLPASVFRRWFRLYLPVFCSTFCICMLAYFGFFEPTRYLFDTTKRQLYFPGPSTEVQPPRRSSLYLQLVYWWRQVRPLINFWTEYPDDPPIDVHLWTIVYEYRSSMHLFITLVALATCKVWARLLLLCFLAYVYSIHLGHAEMVPFYFGAIIAQLDVLRQQKSQHVDTKSSPAATKSSTNSWRSSYRNALYCVALYLMSFPIRGTRYPAPLYKYIVNPLIPKAYGLGGGPRFPKQVGVMLLIHLLTTIPVDNRDTSRWHRLLTSPIATYLGKIMFALFLTHGMVLHTFGYAAPQFVWDHIGGNETNVQYMMGIVFGWVAGLVVALWVADVWAREVESRCVRLTKWLEATFFEQHPGQSVR